MKKKYIVISISIIFLGSLITIIINKNSKEYIMQDGIMLALTLDGEKINTYPDERNYYIEVNCENGKGKWLVEEWKLAVEEITGNVVCNIDFTSNPKTLVSEVEEVNANNNYNNHGYRYSGYNPNNYIWFNNEIWRIIGSIPTCLSANCGTNTTNLIKIIRNEPIGGLVYDASSTSTSSLKGAWGSNTLYSLLNTHYYSTSQSGLNGQNHAGCYGYYGSARVAKAKCDYTGIGILSTSYYGKMVKNVYWNTGASYYYDITVSTMYTNEILKRTVSGYIGLMNASDYGYATNSTYHTNTLDKYTSILEMGLNNWLNNYGRCWTNTQCSEDATRALMIYPGGYFTDTNADNNLVKPVVYLDPSVYIISGDGTEGNPYQIGM